MKKGITAVLIRAACFFLRGLVGGIIMFTLLPHDSSASVIKRIEPEALMNTTDYIILDARPKKIWQSGHIPGAASLSWEDHTIIDKRNIPYRIPALDNLVLALGRLGISEKSKVAVYGDADSSWGGEGWVCWLLAWLGHKGEICLLNGGISAWNQKGYPVSQSENKYNPEIYRASVNNSVLITTQQLDSSLKNIQLVDTRSTFEWFRGSIPGAVHISWKQFFKEKEKKPINADELKTLFKKHHIDPSKPVVYFCTGGIRSAYTWAVHDLAGLGTPINYEGGIEAWKRK